ncbi:MAG TPA: Glu/Leu/Phe/Val dehydrogenase dimerization domain-containing protein [Streptosporangiaceae bacterium]|nr:Glu/Leu/Phe/Val dehydrogenase dimerization domain-containing protein [Streptosporangiaceae bacterium]
MREHLEMVVDDDTGGLSAFLVVDASDQEFSFGGTRVDTAVTRDMVTDLAENMSLKLMGHSSPVGGAKAGVRAAPDDPRLTEFLRRFAEECRDVLSSTTILGKDMGAKQWMLDEIYAQLRSPQLGVARARFPGAELPHRLCDLNGYVSHMTGKGVFWSIEEALGGALDGARVLIQGFGVVGCGVAWHLDRAGAKIVGVSDAEKAILCPEGLDVEILDAARGDDGLLASERLPGTWVPSARDGLLAEQADVLVLAAGSYLVNDEIASRMSTPLVVEAANLALTLAASDVLHMHGVRVVPDVVANSSSAALVAHQIAAGNQRDPAQLWEEIESNIKRNTNAVFKVSREMNITPKAAFRHVVHTAPEPGGDDCAT